MFEDFIIVTVIQQETREKTLLFSDKEKLFEFWSWIVQHSLQKGSKPGISLVAGSVSWQSEASGVTGLEPFFYSLLTFLFVSKKPL